ncbi:MAG: CNP1-like family protein [Betaproteobacteria bacterium]|nr:CNP1-like family protein [Betaproteobacteria bacterium]
MKRSAFCLCAGLGLSLSLGLVAAAAPAQYSVDQGYDTADSQRGHESEVPLPAFPRQENLVEFYVSAPASNHFFIDAKSVSIGPDGVVRYTLVVKTAGGATNISYEGIRCSTSEYKLFATGRSDGAWARARTDDWRPIENKNINRHHAALNSEYFCHDGLPPDSAAEGVAALRRVEQPGAQ